MPQLVSGCEHTRPRAFSFSLNDVEIEGAVREPTTGTILKCAGHRVTGVYVMHIPTGKVAACTLMDTREENLGIALRRLDLYFRNSLDR